MNSSTQTKDQELLLQDYEGLLTDAQYNLIMSALISPAGLALCLNGIVVNCLNIIVFLKMERKDSVTINFLCLSITDLGISTSASITFISTLLVVQFKKEVRLLWFRFDPFIILVLAGNTSESMTAGTLLFTAFLAVQKCCCVIFPFRFRNYFTRFRAILICAVIGCVTMFYTVAFASLYNVDWIKVPNRNKSSLQLVSRTHRDALIHILSWTRMCCLTFGCEVVVVFCVVTMSVALRSADFKKRATINKEEKVDGKRGDQSETPSSSESRVIRTVILISTVFTITNAPALFLAITRMVLPGFGTYGRFGNVYVMTMHIKNFAEVVSSVCNFFIYLKTNTKFRTILRAVIRSRSM